MNDFSFVVKRLQGMNLKKLSREIDVHYITIYNIARGKVVNPKFSTITKLADFLRKAYA